MIYFNNVTKIFPNDCVALNDVSFGISKGEFVSLVGKSGAGKTTLLHLLLAQEKPTEGDIVFEEISVPRISDKYLPYYRRRIGFVHQDFKLLPQKNVFENVSFALEVAGVPPQEIKKTVPQMLELVGLKDKIFNFPPLPDEIMEIMSAGGLVPYLKKKISY